MAVGGRASRPSRVLRRTPCTQEAADIAEAKKEGRPYRPRLVLPKREHMEALQEELVAMGEKAKAATGKAMDFRQQVRPSPCRTWRRAAGVPSQRARTGDLARAGTDARHRTAGAWVLGCLRQQHHLACGRAASVGAHVVKTASASGEQQPARALTAF